jgi:predicted transglutaminase-like cysteine proteinase
LSLDALTRVYIHEILRRAGVPDTDIKIVVGFLKTGHHAGKLHAVLLVDDGEQAAVLDNRFKVQPAESLAGMKQVYCVNRVMRGTTA